MVAQSKNTAPGAQSHAARMIYGGSPRDTQ
jgi:hypothetical protein